MKDRILLFVIFIVITSAVGCSAATIQQSDQSQQIQKLQEDFNILRDGMYDKTMQNINLAIQGANRATSLVSTFAMTFTGVTILLGFLGIKEMDSIRKVRVDAENNLKLTKHFSLASAYTQASLYPEAVKEFLKVLEIDKNNELAHAQLGFLFMSIQQPNNAQSKFHSKQAIEINPNNYTAYLNLGVAMNRDGEKQEDILSVYLKGETIASVQMADEITIGKFRLFAGHCYKELGKKPEAKAKYDQARPLFQKYMASPIPQLSELAKRWLPELEQSYAIVSV